MDEESSSFVRPEDNGRATSRKASSTKESQHICCRSRVCNILCIFLFFLLVFFSFVLYPKTIQRNNDSSQEPEATALPPEIIESTGHDPDLEGLPSTHVELLLGEDVLKNESSLQIEDQIMFENQNDETSLSVSNDSLPFEEDNLNSNSEWSGLSNQKIPTIEEPYVPSDNDMYAVDYFSKEHIDRWEEECNLRRLDVKPGRFMEKMWKADCGGGYVLPKPDPQAKKWKVGLVGSHWNNGIQYLSGCHTGFSCPLSPHCEIVHVSSIEHVRNVNVFLTVAMDHHLMSYVRRPPGTYSVLYWREALWGNVPTEAQQKMEFNLEMGVHYFAGLKNPAFMRPPSFLLQGVHLQVPKSEFAASVISDCRTRSYRELYLAKLVQALGEHRVHRYGRCGNRDFPGKPIIRGMRILAKYKFYLSFENTIERGYTTEKLFELMMLSTVPVYYGDPKAPNITATPSYIRATDFSSPKELAKYLLYLDSHPKEYEKYTSWRQLPEPFTLGYLEEAKHVPGPTERKIHETRPHWMSDRKASCCRLCNEAYLKERAASRDQFAVPPMSRNNINRKFFKG